VTVGDPAANSVEDFSDTAVVMITRNEEGAIGKVVDDILASAPGAEVIVVDGSSDRTPEIARAHGATVVTEPGGGPAPALVTALRASDQPVIVTIDADDTYPTTLIPALVALVRGAFDVAGTNRLGFGRPPAMPLPNYVANVSFNVLATLRSGRRVRDVHTGMRAYRREVIEAFDWDVEGPALPVDLLVWPARKRLRIVEIPIEYRERIGETTLVRLPGTTWTLRRILRPGPPRSAAESSPESR
jgi:glycosyltransferase involved in cell wall biosynthesis